jgi:type VI secretion system protein ImpM
MKSTEALTPRGSGPAWSGQARLLERFYFGKLPARGDFVRSHARQDVIRSVDDWMSRTMERMSLDARWKLVYDQAPAMDFAIVSLQRQSALVGHWLASQDASGRRFPFVLGGVLQADSPAWLAHLAPMVLQPEWQRLRQWAQMARQAQGNDHHELDGLPGLVDDDVLNDLTQGLSVAAAHERWLAFASQHTVASLSQMLAAPARPWCLRQSVLALGHLLVPVLAQGPQRIHKVLCLPLPTDVLRQPEVATWWLHLVLGFLVRSDVEVSVFFGQEGGLPALCLGFQGASAQGLHALIDPGEAEQGRVGLLDAQWVEALVQEDWGLRKLSNYLLDPSLSLQQALDTYREIFLGV